MRGALPERRNLLYRRALVNQGLGDTSRGVMYRLFVAIDFPDEIRRHLVALCLGLPGARWVPPDQLHLTLRFIGEVDGGVFDEIIEILRSVQVPAFILSLKGLGCFPPRRTPRVLWTGIAQSERLVLLRNRIESSLVRVGIEAEGRKFSPHVTLARFREEVHLSRLTSYLAGNALFEAGPFPVDRFLLYSSRLTAKGAIHQVEAEYLLSA